MPTIPEVMGKNYPLLFKLVRFCFSFGRSEIRTCKHRPKSGLRWNTRKIRWCVCVREWYELNEGAHEHKYLCWYSKQRTETNNIGKKKMSGIHRSFSWRSFSRRYHMNSSPQSNRVQTQIGSETNNMHYYSYFKTNDARGRSTGTQNEYPAAVVVLPRIHAHQRVHTILYLDSIRRTFTISTGAKRKKAKFYPCMCGMCWGGSVGLDERQRERHVLQSDINFHI